MMSVSFDIVYNIPPEHAKAAAHLHFEAFKGKIGGLLGRDGRGHAFFADIINPRFGICAIDCETGAFLGVAGFKTNEGSLIDGRFHDLCQHYGMWGAVWRAPILALLEREIEADTLLMDGIAVVPESRGLGVGSQLLDAVEREAENRGKKYIRLDVIDKNPRAKALYERKGFVARAEENLGPLKYIFGFNTSTTMVKQLINQA